MVMIKELFSSGRFQQWTTVDTEGMVMVTASVIQDSDRLSKSAPTAIVWLSMEVEWFDPGFNQES